MVPDRAARKESLQWLGCSLQGIHSEPMACTPSHPSSFAFWSATCLLG